MLLCANVVAQTPGNTTISATDCPICTDAQWAQWQIAYSHSSRVTARDVLGQRIGLNHARSHNADSDDGPKWENLDVMKRTVCGPLSSFSVSVFDSEEFDWGFKVTPNAHYSGMIDEAKAAAAVTLDQLGYEQFGDVDQVADLLAADVWNGKIKGEITPDEDFRHSDFFQGYPPLGLPAYSPLEQDHRQVCLYGPFVLDIHHALHPEIHPSELIWWRDASNIWLLVLQDDSDRFDFDNELVTFATRPWQVQWMKEDPANWTRPWAAWPRWAEFRVAFKADPTGNSATRYRIEELEAQHVITHKIDSAVFDTDNGNGHVLESGGKTLVEVIEAQPDNHVGVRFSEVCRTKTGQGQGRALIGFVTLSTVVGDGGAELGGFQLLKVKVMEEANIDAFLAGLDDVPDVRPIDSILLVRRPITDSISVLQKALGGNRFSFDASSMRRVGGRLVADIRPDPDSSQRAPRPRSAWWLGKNDSTSLKLLIARKGEPSRTPRILEAPILEPGHLAIHAESGPSFRLSIPRIAQVPLVRSSRPHSGRSSTAADSALIAALGNSAATTALGKARSAASWVVSIEPRYAPIVDSTPHPEDEGPLVEVLNNAIRGRENPGKQGLRELFGKTQPFVVRWGVTVTNNVTGQRMDLRVDDKLRSNIRAMTQKSLHGNSELRILFPQSRDTVFRVDAVATVSDSYGMLGSVRHRLWSHYLGVTPSDSTEQAVARLAAGLAGISADSLLSMAFASADKDAHSGDSIGSMERRLRLAAAFRSGIRRVVRDGIVTIGELQGLVYSARLYQKAPSS
jgi:hypothetical protein